MCVLAPVLPAQTVAPLAGPAADDSITELSPFVIRENTDVGYVGAQSLLGSRFRQELRDIPAQIEVFTPEFMLDFDLTRTEDVFKYSASFENTQEYVSPDNGGSAVWSSATNGRVRGLQPSSFTVAREMFSAITASDSYNLDRIELASGAQSLLFSLGEPAGMANMSLKRAHLRNTGQLSMRGDTEGGYRMVFDVNRRLIEHQLGLRLAAVNENRPQFIKPSHDRNTRLYGTATFQPFRGTTIRVHGEAVREDSNRPVTHLPWDWATPYFIAKKNGTLDQLSTVGFGSLQQAPVLIWGANSAPIQFVHWRTQAGLTSPGRLPLDPVKYGPAFDPNSGVERITFNPDNINLIPEVAAMVGKNFLGDNVRNRLKSRQLDFFLEQRVGNLFRIELGGHQEKWDKKLEQLAGYNLYGYQVDINRYIPKVPWAASTAVPDFSQNLPINASYMLNPNYGKLYFRSSPNFAWNIRETEEYRATIAADPDLRRWRKWLGRHSLLGAASTRETSGKNQGGGIKLTNPRLAYQNNNAMVYSAATRALTLQQYFDLQNVTVTRPFGDRMSFSDYFNGFDYQEPITGEVLRVSGWDFPYGSRPTGSKSKIDSALFAWQGRLLDDRIQLGYGVRRDDVKSFKLDQDYIGGSAYDPVTQAWQWVDSRGWDPVPNVSDRNTSRTYGIVVRPLRWLTLSYYESATFNISTGSLTPYGDEIPGVSGRSKDYSVRADFLDGRVFLKLNAYDVVQEGRMVGGVLPIDAFRMENSYYQVVLAKSRLPGAPTYEQVLLQEGVDRGVTGQTTNITSHPMTGDTTSKGVELTGGARFGRLDVRLSGAKTDAKTGNVATTWESWVRKRQPYWEKAVDVNGNTWDKIPYQGSDTQSFVTTDPVTGVRRVLTMKEFWDQVLVMDLASAKASNGKPVDTERKYRANLNVAYSFAGERLKGVRLGGALLYRSGAILGFPAKPLEAPGQAFPIPVLDFAHPYRGSSDFNVDAFVAYSGRNFLGSRKAWRLQINGSNLLTGERSFRTGRVNARNEPVFTIIETPRAGSATLSFEF